jgi:hypothetical protein
MYLSIGNGTPVITYVVMLIFHTFQLKYMFSGTNCVQKSGTARISFYVKISMSVGHSF